MVQELLHRYETNKKKAKYGSKEEVKEKRNVAPLDDDDDDFEFDENELDLWDGTWDNWSREIFYCYLYQDLF